MDVGRPVRRPVGGSQKLTYRAVDGNWVCNRHQRDKLEGSIFICPETAAEIVVRLVLVLVFIKSVCRCLPDVENRPLNRRLFLKVIYSSGDPNARSRGVITCNGIPSFAQRRIGTKERPHQGKTNGLAQLLVIER